MVPFGRCLLFLIDRSGSMSDAGAGEASARALRAAAAVDRAVAALLAGRAATPARARVRLGVLGYGDGVASALRPGGALRDLVALRDLERVGGPWVVAAARGGTATCAALGRAADLARRWARRNPRAEPLCVIHLTDGQATDGDPAGAAEALVAVRTRRGATLLANVLLSSGAAPAASFPARLEEPGEAQARRLHAMSSELPLHLRRALRRRGVLLAPRARAFVAGPDVDAGVVALALAAAGVREARPAGPGGERRAGVGPRRSDQTRA